MTDPRVVLEQALAGRYLLQGELGSGGMATVYLAEDLRHGRQLALKVLRPDISAAIGAERFRREIEIAAALHHPNILPLFDSGEAGGLLYYLMPRVEGESLRERLARDTRLPADVALRIFHEVADALAYAHERNVVHRDVKPENILLERDHAFLMDFGIAQAASNLRESRFGGDRVRVTQAGSILGTPAYMSPEQTLGDTEVDGRSDQYSLACVLYEALSGELPFPGTTAEAILVQRFTQSPPRLSRRLKDAPAALESALARAMAREVAERFPGMERFAQALREPAAAEDTRGKSIAVLPFTNLSAAPEDEYFADGITEEILNALGQLEGLRVAARTSSFVFKGKREDLRSVGEKLNVSTVLEGSVRKAGQRLRISAQLVNAQDGYQMWSERFDRELTDVFEIQDQIAQAIAARLKLVLAVGEARTPRRGTHDLEAYEQFLKGRALQWQRGQLLAQARASFERALELDPLYVDAMAWLADNYRLAAVFGLLPVEESIRRARELAERALELDPAQDEAWATMAEVALVWDRDPARAVAGWDRALELNPSQVRARVDRALWGQSLLREDFEGAISEVRAAVAGDPLNSWARGMLALSLGMARQLEECATEAERAVELDDSSFVARWILTQALSWSGRHAEAMESAATGIALSGRHPFALGALALAHGAAGRKEVADAAHRELRARAAFEPVSEVMIAMAALACDQREEALSVLEKGDRNRDSALFLLSGHPQFDPLRGEPRFRAVLEAIRGRPRTPSH